jgi:alkylhydroperoxidase family enzyme
MNARISHEAIGRAAGLTGAQLAAIRDDSIVPHPGSPALTPRQHVALQYVDYMTREVKVPQTVFDKLRSMLADDKQMVEVTMTIATYNMVSRILVALDVADKADETVPNPE